MPWHKPALASAHSPHPVPTCATPRWCHKADPRRASRTPPALEIALTARLAGVFDPDARAHGAPAAGIASLFRILGEHKTEAACALLNVVQHEMRPYGLEGASLFMAAVPLAARIVEALSQEPEQAAACILEARALSSTKRLDSVNRVVRARASRCGYLHNAAQHATVAIRTGKSVIAMPDDSFWSLTDCAADAVDELGTHDDFRVSNRCFTHATTGAAVAPCSAWCGGSGLGARCCLCHTAIEQPGDVRVCDCLCATACASCAANSDDSASKHCGCVAMIRRADRLVHRLRARPGNQFTCFAPGVVLLIPVPTTLALTTPSLPVLWPPSLADADIATIQRHGRLLARRFSSDDGAGAAMTRALATLASNTPPEQVDSRRKKKTRKRAHAAARRRGGRRRARRLPGRFVAGGARGGAQSAPRSTRARARASRRALSTPRSAPTSDSTILRLTGR